jgi:dolichol-phosphate mannosyltransferase
MSQRKESYKYSVVIPIYNEQENLPELERRLSQVLGKLEEPYEVIFVNDGSRDGSIEILKDFTGKDSRLKVIDLSRNFGHQAAFYAGMRRASGEAVILMDGDLQDPPEILPQLIQRWHQGYDVVYAVRQKRQEGLVKRALYAAYYRLLRRIAYVDIPLDAGDFALMSRRVILLLCDLPERNKFLRGLRSWVGFRQTYIVYDRDARYAGKTKYTPAKLWKLALDGLISYSYIPLRISYMFGFVVSLCSFLLAAFYFIQKLLLKHHIPQGFTTLAILILFLGGVQLISIGVLGEYLGRIYDEVKHRPEYIERHTIGFDLD